MINRLANFNEGLTFAAEIGMDVAALCRDAEQIVAAFLAAHGDTIAAYDSHHMGEGAAAFALALAMTFEPSAHHWLQSYADEQNESRAHAALVALGYACAVVTSDSEDYVTVGGQAFDGFAAAANAMSTPY